MTVKKPWQDKVLISVVSLCNCQRICQNSKVYNIINTVIWLSHLCCNSVLYFLNNLSVIFFTQLHFISEYCRILSTTHHLRLYWNWLNTVVYYFERSNDSRVPCSQRESDKVCILLIAIITYIMYTSWFAMLIISLSTVQNKINLKLILI
jgi:hypothetical protein